MTHYRASSPMTDGKALHMARAGTLGTAGTNLAEQVDMLATERDLLRRTLGEVVEAARAVLDFPYVGGSQWRTLRRLVDGVRPDGTIESAPGGTS